MEICTHTSFSKDTKKTLLQLISNIRHGITAGIICNSDSLGIAAAHLREIAEYIETETDELHFETAMVATPEGDEVSDFLQQVPDSWEENPWPEILHPGWATKAKSEAKKLGAETKAKKIADRLAKGGAK